MHASGSETGDPYRFSNFLAVHTWTHAPEQMISVISCVYGGLFEKFQRLRIGRLGSVEPRVKAKMLGQNALRFYDLKRS